jgi:hypothetical protein
VDAASRHRKLDVASPLPATEDRECIPHQLPLYSNSAEYRGSHRDLLRTLPGLAPPQQASGLLDVIVVPTSRRIGDGLPGIELAARLAVETDSWLVVLCSGSAHAHDFPASSLTSKIGRRLICRDLPDREHLFLPMFHSSRNRLSSLHRSTDTGVKRNLALTLACASQWTTILFLDDDIMACASVQTLDAYSLEKSLAALAADRRLRAVGWPVDVFADNSVIGHTRRILDREQDTFVGGGALLVRCDRNVPFFPDIYNEDWLFLIAAARSSYRDSIGLGGFVQQLTFDPFSRQRAKAEEVGDIIAEGLMNLLEDGDSALLTQGGTRRYWHDAISLRASLIQELDEALAAESLPESASTYSPVHDALSAALAVHELIGPEIIASYIRDWELDLADWQAHLALLATSGLHRWRDPAGVLDWLLSAGAPRPPTERRDHGYQPRHTMSLPAAPRWAVALSALVGVLTMQAAGR